VTLAVRRGESTYAGSGRKAAVQRAVSKGEEPMQWNKVRTYTYRGLAFGMMLMSLVMASGAGHQWGK
jgi:hypothetical protein